MSDTPETTQPDELHHLDDVKVGTILYWGFVSVAATLLTMMFLHSLYGWYMGNQRQAKSFGNQGEHEFARTEITRQENVLHAAPGWADEAKTRVAIPIERAIALTLEEYNSSGASGDEAGVAPTNEEPATQPPATEGPATAEPDAEEPASEEPPAADEEMEEATEELGEQPATEEPSSEEPATEEPTDDEPPADEPATEEPSTEEPASEEPTDEDPTTDESPSK